MTFKTKSGLIVRALRCTCSSPPKEDPEECCGCPYQLKESAEWDGKTITVHTCDCDKVGLDAADLIEAMTNG